VWQIEEEEEDIGRTCSRHGGSRDAYNILVEHFNRSLENSGVVGWIILKCISWIGECRLDFSV
jgi:hypothetical protein